MSKKKSHFEKKFCPSPGQVVCPKKNHICEKKFCPRQRSCQGQVVCPKKVRFLRKSSAPGSAAAPDMWLGREKTNNLCSQGRGAPFRGFRGAETPGKAGGCGGGTQPPRLPPPRFEPQVIVKLPRCGPHPLTSFGELASGLTSSQPPKEWGREGLGCNSGLGCG